MELSKIDITKTQTAMSNSLLKGKYELSQQEQSLVYLLISQIEKDDTDFKEYKITVSDLDKISEVKHNKQRIKLLVDTIMQRLVRFTDNDGNQVTTHWFSSIKALKGESALIVRFDPSLKPCFLEFAGNFTVARLKSLLSYKSKYSSRLLLLIKSDYDRHSKKQKSFEYTIDELCDMFQLPKSYRQVYKNFKTDFLIRSIDEINKKDNEISVEYTAHKSGRKIKSIEFRITEKVQIIKQKETVESVLIEHGISHSHMKYVSTWGLHLNAVKHYVKYIKKNDLEHIIIDMLMSGYDKIRHKDRVFNSACASYIKEHYKEEQTDFYADLEKHLDEAIKSGDIQI